MKWSFFHFFISKRILVRKLQVDGLDLSTLKWVIFAGNWDKYDNWPLNSASKIKYYNYYSL